MKFGSIKILREAAKRRFECAATLDTLVKYLNETLHSMIKPHDFLKRCNPNNDDKRAAFNNVMAALDKVYEPSGIETPRQRLVYARGALVFTFINLMEMSTFNQEVRNFVSLDDDNAAWQMYQLMVPILDKYVQIVDMKMFIRAGEECGLYDECGGLILLAAPPHDPTPTLKNRGFIADYYTVLDCVDAEIYGPVLAFVLLRKILQVTKFDRQGSAFLEVADSDEHSTHMCTICGRNERCTVYLPSCKHFMCCDVCTLNIDRSRITSCHICNAPINDIIVHVERGVSTQCYVTPCDMYAVERKIAESPSLPQSVIDNARALYNSGNFTRALQYITKVLGDGGDAAESTARNHYFRVIYNSDWFVELMNTASGGDNITVMKATHCDIIDFVKENPRHTVDQVMELVKIDRVFESPTGECISCMEDDRELLIMSKCGHRAMCRDCLKMNGRRCPICRSENNNILRA